MEKRRRRRSIKAAYPEIRTILTRSIHLKTPKDMAFTYCWPADKLVKKPSDSAVVICGKGDFLTIYQVINESSRAYSGVIPDACWKEPYMSKDELRAEIQAGVVFLGCKCDGTIGGVMGTQDVKDVTLIRHAYVLPAYQRNGVGSLLLKRLLGMSERPVLVGTWAAASWAVRFYMKHGFRLVSGTQETLVLLRKYWTVSVRQIRASVVLADKRWFEKQRQ